MSTGEDSVKSRISVEPVKLKSEFIKEILQSVHVRGIGKSGMKLSRQVLQNKLYEHLVKVKLVDHPKAREKFKAEIVRQYNDTSSPHGDPVGYSAAFAAGGPLTQMSLNSFHYAGTESGLSGVFSRVRSMLMGSELNRNPITTIFFKDQYTGDFLHDAVHYDETLNSIIARRGEIEETLVSNLVLETSFLNKAEKDMIGFDNLLKLHKLLRPTVFASKNFNGINVLSVKLDTYRMYTHRLTMQDVCTAFEGLVDDKVSSDLACLWKSQRDGVIYIIANEGQGNLNDPLKNTIFLDFLAKFIFQTMYLKGIPKITSLVPESIETDSIVRDYKFDTKNKEIQIRTNLWMTRVAGPSLMDLVHLFNLAGIPARFPDVIDESNPFISVSYNDVRKDSSFPEINKKNASKMIYERYKNFKEKSKSKPDSELTENEKKFKSASTIWYGIAKGVNLDEILWRDDVDSYRTYPNDVHLITQRIGIEAARAYIIREFIKTLSGSYINPKHIILIYDVLTNLGEITPMTLSGLNRRSVGTLSAAATANAISMIAQGSIQGQRDTATTVSASICLGIPARLGTGAIGTKDNENYIKSIPPIPQVDPTVIEQLKSITLSRTIFNDFMLGRIMEQSSIVSEEIVEPIRSNITNDLTVQPTVIFEPSQTITVDVTPQQTAMNKIINSEGFTEDLSEEVVESLEAPVVGTFVRPESSKRKVDDDNLAYVMSGAHHIEKKRVYTISTTEQLNKTKLKKSKSISNFDFITQSPSEFQLKKKKVPLESI